MKPALLVAFLGLLSGCASPPVKTPVEFDPKEPFVFHEYPEASVYRLLSAPQELAGARVRTYGYVRFFFDGSIGFLYASRNDAREKLPQNFVELHFSQALAAKDWFRGFSKKQVLFKGWIVGVYRIPPPDVQNQRLVLEDITEFDVESER